MTQPNNCLNYYDILGVKHDATHTDIKKAFRTLSLKLHPDKQGGNEDEFKRINEAYTILSDPDKKREYDVSLTRSKQNVHINMTNMNEMFNGIFNNDTIGNFIKINIEKMAKNMSMKKPIPIIKTIEITLKQSFEGYTYPLSVERFIITDNSKPEEKTTENEMLYLDIPAGIDDNEIIIVNSKGNIIEDNIGDIKCFIKVTNETEFIRNGLDIIYKKQLSLKDALCGFCFHIDHLDGKTYNINNSVGKIIIPGMKQIIPKLGMRRNNTQGNLIIDFDIKFPDNLTNEQRDILNKVL